MGHWITNMWPPEGMNLESRLPYVPAWVTGDWRWDPPTRGSTHRPCTVTRLSGSPPATCTRPSTGYLHTVGSRSPGCARGSGRAAAGTPRSHTAPARCGRCTEYRSLCSTFLLLQSTLPQARGKWRGHWALASAPRDHLKKDAKSEHEKVFLGSHTSARRTWCCLL